MQHTLEGMDLRKSAEGELLDCMEAAKQSHGRPSARCTGAHGNTRLSSMKSTAARPTPTYAALQQTHTVYLCQHDGALRGQGLTSCATART